MGPKQSLYWTEKAHVYQGALGTIVILIKQKRIILNHQNLNIQVIVKYYFIAKYTSSRNKFSFTWTEVKTKQGTETMSKHLWYLQLVFILSHSSTPSGKYQKSSFSHFPWSGSPLPCPISLLCSYIRCFTVVFCFAQFCMSLNPV